MHLPLNTDRINVVRFSNAGKRLDVVLGVRTLLEGRPLCRSRRMEAITTNREGSPRV
ncbi:hypothetical protein TWF481_002270 [Arthrobotrys musiformis]|uniref:Uncharacterized protein n=1 Tax=Arthrobotrys musiformis TaxID=47236 RepID=A0AAV9VST7_9PEZI